MTTPYSTTTAPATAPVTPPARFLLLGDSHAACVGRAAEAAGLSFQGGPVGSGRDFLGPFFDPEGADVVFRDAEAQRLYRRFLEALGAPSLGRSPVPLVCTFGLSAHTVATRENWAIHRDAHGAHAPGFLGGDLFAALVRTTARGALAFYEHAVALGLRVLALMPPQRVPAMSDPAVFFAAQHVLCAELVERGVEVVDLRARVTDRSGLQRPAFCEADDPIHGNLAFGRLLVADLLDRGL
ncbi:hypothetical protein Shyhy01_19530 [Streptomyces hygroscopicus subsp. hygroscopicus]|nr:hypothetical protein [Streptomyces hygroscopicus]GLX49003.1 hypothetical protein Shyhy01_19530 [Streptomyces hygroscopicus subsp. hygroscopicus]